MQKDAITYDIAEGQSVRLVQITDPHLYADPHGHLLGVNTTKSLLSVLDTVRTNHDHVDFMLATGDISQDYSPESYQSFAKLVTELGLPCHYLPGNHDDVHIMNLHLQGPNISGHKRILVGNWQILMLDSTVRGKPGGYLSDAEVTFIEQALALEPQRHCLLVMHHNPVLTGAAWLDQHCLANGEQVLARCSQWANVRGILWGHVHQQIDKTFPSVSGNIQLMATPSTCIQFTPESDFFALDNLQPGYRLLDLNADGSMETHVYRVPGKMFFPDLTAGGY
ncbi:3',5'-cyclic-AMP phosphodiesterase [Shewanella sp. NIFS-20-20]|uniref:3',5'-cyclic-AMP phosphodiesterase n=1 Tax=Shewanella sp. NIFS-20-20 TaxID=2853806 RepID=UPI001C442F34|nr:3',5'-cyclic-AMP phosphodiesterase [Shewanella sp. NIFS-20-20]MBV7317050.1 3',5'-cyclic-AMP phosphodiesterase [Shewanella sp. NIFS-20-20]